MKILKSLIFIILGLIALLLIAGLFIKKEYGVERQVVILKSRTEVFNYIKLLRNQDNFSVWATRDPGMKKEFRGTDGTVGAISAWDSESDEVG